jgi:hypothetical protein
MLFKDYAMVCRSRDTSFLHCVNGEKAMAKTSMLLALAVLTQQVLTEPAAAQRCADKQAPSDRELQTALLKEIDRVYIMSGMRGRAFLSLLTVSRDCGRRFGEGKYGQYDAWVHDIHVDAEIFDVWATFNLRERNGSIEKKEEFFKCYISTRREWACHNVTP